MNLLKLTAILALTCSAMSAQASMALRGKSFNQQSSQEQVTELNIHREFVKQGRKVGFDKSDIAAIIPTNIPTTNKGRFVRDQILLKTGSSIAKSHYIRDNFITRAAKKIEKKAAVDIKIKAKPTIANKKPVEHKFKFDLQAFKKEARMIYTGYLKSKVEYKAKEDIFQFSVEEQLSKNSRIALSHEKNRIEKRQFLHYQVNW